MAHGSWLHHRTVLYDRFTIANLGISIWFIHFHIFYLSITRPSAPESCVIIPQTAQKPLDGPGNSDGDDDEEGDHEMHGNPGVHIVELGEDGQPIMEPEAEGEANIQNAPAADVVEEGGDILSPTELLDRELRKRKHGLPTSICLHGPENGESSNAQKRKIETESHSPFIRRGQSNDSTENHNNDEHDRAAVGPVPPPVP
ncbi:unnamed protein product [Arabidopsis halleri]